MQNILKCPLYILKAITFIPLLYSCFICFCFCFSLSVTKGRIVKGVSGAANLLHIIYTLILNTCFVFEMREDEKNTLLNCEHWTGIFYYFKQKLYAASLVLISIFLTFFKRSFALIPSIMELLQHLLFQK